MAITGESKDKTGKQFKGVPQQPDGPGERAARAAKQIESEAATGTITVRATKVGVYIGRRQVDEVFEFPVSRLVNGKLPSWMEKVGS